MSDVAAELHWREFFGYLRDKQSAMSHAPRHALQHDATDYLRSVIGKQEHTRLALLQPDEFISGGQVDWSGCAETLGRQWHWPAPDCQDDDDFHRLLSNWLEDADDRLIIGVGLGASSSVEGRFELITMLHYALSEYGPDALTLAVQDDYTLYYYESWRTQNVSRWDYLHRVHLRALRKHDIEAALRRSLPDLKDEQLTAFASEVERLTGGHLGLVAELRRDLVNRQGRVDDRYWRKEAPAVLAASHSIESIRRSLQENSFTLTQGALEYDTAKPVRDYNNPTVQRLRTLGVLQWTTDASARVCPGAIKNVVKEIAQGTEAADSTAGLYAASPRVLKPTNLTPSDDDIVIAHVSDIHVGSPYAFRLPVPEADRQDRHSAADMLKGDLKACGLSRVDGFVMSGDFTQTADLSEFSRARDVLGDVLAAGGASWSDTVVVAGNHDVRWNPPPSAIADPMTKVSRDEFNVFRELIGKKRDCHADVHLIVSKSGRRALRLVAIDSNLVEGPEAGGIGYVGTDTIRQAEELLAAQKIPDTVVDESIWIVVHHHVLPVNSAPISEAHKRKVSVMANAAGVLSFAMSCGAEAILHGHEHQPSITLTRRWPVDRGQNLAPLAVIGAGSFGCKRDYLGPFARNHYYLLIRRANEIVVRSRMTGDEGLAWVSHADISIPIDGTKSKDKGKKLNILSGITKALGVGRKA